MRRMLLALALVGCSCVTHVANENPPMASWYRAQDLASKTVALVRGNGNEAYCSGVWVTRGKFLTANHCVSAAALGDEIRYATQADMNGEQDVMLSHVATLEARDAGHDLALLAAPYAGNKAFASLAAYPPVQGDFVQTMGHPLGLLYSYSNGVIAAARYESGAMSAPMWWWQTTAQISPGNSGCGLFDANDDLVGVAHGSYVFGQGVNLFVHKMYLDEFLKGRLTPALASPTLTHREGRGEAL